MPTIYYARMFDGGLMFQLENTTAVMRYYYRPNDAKEESNSISYQRCIVEEYINTDDVLSAAEQTEFVDDGYSGTSFDRPGVTKMLNAIKTGSIDCVIVKDFSRFGRNKTEVGDYLEQIFPLLGVRFISVCDQYDSNDYPFGTAGIMDVSVQNLFHELYCKDLSDKLICTKNVFLKKGSSVAAFLCMGM